VRMKPLTLGAVGVALLTLVAKPATGQEPENCLLCHGNGQMFAGSRDSARLVVSQRILERSVHGPPGLACSMCHAGMDFPHPDAPPAVNCGTNRSTDRQLHAAIRWRRAVPTATARTTSNPISIRRRPRVSSTFRSSVASAITRGHPSRARGIFRRTGSWRTTRSPSMAPGCSARV
jgi:hypothetical protein